MSWVVGMAPEEEKMTRRSPLDFPIVSFSFCLGAFVEHFTAVVGCVCFEILMEEININNRHLNYSALASANSKIASKLND